MKRIFLISFIFTALIFSGLVYAKDFRVNNTDNNDPTPRAGACANPGDPCSLREAVIAANNSAGSHTITLSGGVTYTLSLSDPVPTGMASTDEDDAQTGDLDLKNEIEIKVTGNEKAIVTGDTNFIGRIFHIPKNFTVKISNVILQKGAITNVNGGGISNGGGMGNTGGNLTLENVTIQNNWAKTTAGGGLDSSGSSTTLLKNCSFTQNTAAQGGGAIYHEASGSLTINNSTIIANGASYAGGLLSYGKLALNNVEISSNNANSAGSTAGIIISGNEATIGHSNILNNLNTTDNSIANVKVTVHENLATAATLTMNNSTVNASSTTAFSKCVNILNAGGKLNLNQNTLKLDGATCSGKGVEIRTSELVSGMIRFQPSTTLTNSTLSGYNVGLYVESTVTTPAKTTIQQSTFHSTLPGAETIRVDSTTANMIEIKNSILGNACSYSAGTTPVKTNGFNLERTTTCLPSPLGTNDRQDVSDFKFGNSGNPGSNGGTTETYSLIPGGPAIDQGDCTGLTNPTDQRGMSRPRGNNICDIGAYEAISSSEAFSFSSTSIEFGKVPLKTGTHSQEVRIRNISNIALTFPSADIPPDPKSPFGVNLGNNCIGTTLRPMDPSSSCTIVFTFAPQKVGPVSGTIEIPASFFVISNSPVVFRLNAEVISDTPPLLLVPKLALDRPILLFEKTEIGKTVSADLTITNSGTASLVLQQIALEGDSQNNFKVTGCENRSIEPQKNCVLKISFTPATKGSLAAKLIISNNDPLNRKTEVALSGEGTSKDVVTAGNQSTSGCNILAASTMNLPGFLLPIFSILAIRFVKREKK